MGLSGKRLDMNEKEKKRITKIIKVFKYLIINFMESLFKFRSVYDAKLFFK